MFDLFSRYLPQRFSAISHPSLLQGTIEKERILNTLMTKSRQSAHAWTWADNSELSEADSARAHAISHLRRIPDWSVGEYLGNLYELSLPVDSSVVTSFTDRITELVDQVRTAPHRIASHRIASRNLVLVSM